MSRLVARTFAPVILASLGAVLVVACRSPPPEACWPRREIARPADCSTIAAGCPCRTELEIRCHDVLDYGRFVCIHGVWEASPDPAFCRPGSSIGSCRSRAEVGCPCCDPSETICYGSDEGRSCQLGRWMRFADGPCGPGGPDSRSFGPDVRLDPPRDAPVELALDATPMDAALDAPLDVGPCIDVCLACGLGYCGGSTGGGVDLILSTG